MQAEPTYWDAVLHHWKAVVLSWLGLAGLVFGATALSALNRPAWIWIGVLVLGLFVAQYLAWRDSRDEARSLRRELDDSRNRLEEVRNSRTLAFQSLQLSVFKGSPLSESEMQVGILLHNYGSVVVRYRVESMSVVIDGKTALSPTFSNLGADVFPGADSLYEFPAISGLDVTQPLLPGQVVFSITYGPSDLEPSRRLAETLAVDFLRSEGTTINQVRWKVKEESDEPISLASA